MKLDGKKVVIAGGSSGIGLAIARSILSEGGEAILVGRTQARLARAVSELDGDERCRSFVCDVANETQVAELADKVGPIDHLVITAPGDLVYKPFEDITLSEARKAIDVKLIGAFLMVKYLRPVLSSMGSIVLTAGINAHIPPGRSSVISAANGALEAFARALAVELGPIRVNVLSPGWVDTPIWSAIADDTVKAQMFQDMADRLPVGRIGSPEDIAQAAMLLLDNAYMTGSVLHVEGGRRLL